MDLLKLGFLLLSGISMTVGGPRYIAIPIDGIDVIELNPISPPSPRLPRQTDAYVPMAVSNIHPDSIENPAQRPERSTAHILDYVDFGAHTGVNGAYNWYADYPSRH